MQPPDGPVLVCGLGRVGSRVLEFLHRAGVPVAVLDSSPTPAVPDGIVAYSGDCRDPRALLAAGADRARGFVVCTSDDLTNLACAFAVRRLNRSGRIVVRMFNESLVDRLGGAVANTTALSVSALTAPLLVVTALTGDSLGSFPAGDAGATRVAELLVTLTHAGRRVGDVAGESRLLVVALTTFGQPPRLFSEVRGDEILRFGDRLALCGPAADVERLLAPTDDPLSGVYWAGRVRRAVRGLVRAVSAIDLAVKLVLITLATTLVLSTLVFRFGLRTSWAEGLYRTVSAIGTVTDLHGDALPDWAKVFVSLLKLAGAALLAAFTAILTQYLVRARLAGALEVRRIPERGHVVVCGLGNVGYRCVLELKRLGVPAVVIERDPQASFAPTVRRMGVAVIQGDAATPVVLSQARAATARAVLATTSSELANLEIALLVRGQNPAARVVVRLTEPDFAEAVRAATGLTLAVSTSTIAAPAFAAALSGDRVRLLIPAAGRTLAAVELLVREGDGCLDGVPLAAAMLDYEFLPVALAGREPFAGAGIPGGARLKAGDRLTLLIELDKLARLLAREPAPRDWAGRDRTSCPGRHRGHGHLGPRDTRLHPGNRRGTRRNDAVHARRRADTRRGGGTALPSRARAGRGAGETDQRGPRAGRIN